MIFRWTKYVRYTAGGAVSQTIHVDRFTIGDVVLCVIFIYKYF